MGGMSKEARHAAPATRWSWSVAPTLLWFVGLTALLLWIVDGHPPRLAELVAEDDDKPVASGTAGPSFVAQAAADTEAEVATTAGLPLPPPVPEAPVPVVPMVLPGGVAPAAVPFGIEDTCIDPIGATAGCKRHAMDAYYTALRRVEAGIAVARASLFGDSVISSDYITSPMRARLAARFGDGGAGWLYLAKPSRWYGSLAARLGQSDNWLVQSIVNNPARDGLFGPAGASATGIPGSWATWGASRRAPGDKVSRFEVYFLAGPAGGAFEATIDGGSPETIDTRAPSVAPGWHTFTVSDGPHDLKLRVVRGRVRGFGVTLERADGVIVDNLGLMAGTAKALMAIEDGHFDAEVEHRAPDLIMVQFGANESMWIGADAGSRRSFETGYERALAKLRKARPAASCLVISTLDSARFVNGRTVTKPGVPGMVDAERAAAGRQGCAFWDARAFMGGEGSASRWYKKHLISPDLTHPTRSGGAALGDAIADAIVAGYAQFKAKH
jgi:lysophospholipase L1-like esterase